MALNTRVGNIALLERLLQKCWTVMTTQRDDRCVHLSPGLNTIPASCLVSHIAHIQSHTPPLRLPSSSWLAGVISSSQLLVWWTTDWTSSCRELQERRLLYRLHLRASGEWAGDKKIHGFSSVSAFPHVIIIDKYWLTLLPKAQKKLSG